MLEKSRIEDLVKNSTVGLIEKERKIQKGLEVTKVAVALLEEIQKTLKLKKFIEDNHGDIQWSLLLHEDGRL